MASGNILAGSGGFGKGGGRGTSHNLRHFANNFFLSQLESFIYENVNICLIIDYLLIQAFY